MTNNLQQTLTDKLKAKMIEDRKALEQSVEMQLRMLTQNIQKQFNDANASIAANMVELKRKLRLYQAKTWIFPLVFGLLFIPGLVIGTYWTNNYLDSTIIRKLETLKKHNRTLRALGDVKIEHVIVERDLYLISPSDKKPEVFQNKFNKWVIKIEG